MMMVNILNKCIVYMHAVMQFMHAVNIDRVLSSIIAIAYRTK